MAVAIYVRVSTEEQRERQSIRTQLEFAERYCGLHKLTTYRTYSDDGISGTVPLERRPEGSQILAEALAGKFDQLLVYKLDRLGRETRLILNAVAELEKAGVRVRSMTEDFDTGTATGRLMLTMLSGFASHEREVIRERSVAGTFRVAEAGAWLGGIVPYGYRKVGDKRDARLAVSEEPIPNLAISEVEVVREVFRLSAEEHRSCFFIAARLNEMRVPCAYVRDDRLLLRGKRKERTSGKWTPGRIRHLLTSKTYMGLHEYGKRSTTQRPVVTRPCAPIVSEEVWKQAQKTLEANFLFSARSARNQYLLRGLIKCQICGLTYVGVAATRANGKREFYYRCNGVHTRGMFGRLGKPCPGKAVRGDYLEQIVWGDLEQFLRDPGPVLSELRSRLESDASGAETLTQQQRAIEALLANKAGERSRIFGLYRRGRLSDAELDEQIQEMEAETNALRARIGELSERLRSAQSIAVNVGSAEALLKKLRTRLKRSVSWEIKRQLVEVLVSGLTVDTVEEYGVKQPKVTICYRFEQTNALERTVAQPEYLRHPVRIPTNPQTLGDHVRLRRLHLKLRQKDVAERLGVNQCSVYNWEKNVSQPAIQFLPAIIDFLGFDPRPAPNGIGERLVHARKSLGLTRPSLAKRLDVDPSTLARWERGERQPEGRYEVCVNQFLAERAITTSLPVAS